MLLAKPVSCQGCPAYGDGKGYVPDDIVDGARVSILLQNPGPDEEMGRKVVSIDQHNRPVYEVCDHKPAIGRTGFFMDGKLLPLAGLVRGENVSVLNILKCRWETNGKKVNELPKGHALAAAVAQCTSRHLVIPSSTTLIVAAGQLAWEWTQQSKLSISSWRGFVGPKRITLPSASPPTLPATSGVLGSGGCSTPAGTCAPVASAQVPVLATLHPADLFRERRMIMPSRSDWKKVPEILAGTYPIALPERLVISPETSLDEIDAYFDAAEENAHQIAIDTEYVPESSLLTIVGVGYTYNRSVAGIQLEWLKREIPSRLRAVFIRRLSVLLARSTAILWNAQADLPILKKNLGITPHAYEDGMLAHAALWSELPHDLVFASSVYSPFTKPQFNEVGFGLTKNWGDVCATVACWEALEKGLQVDPGAHADYRLQKLPMVPILFMNHVQGLRVNKPRVEAAIPQYTSKLVVAERIAQASVGWPISLGSPKQLSYWLYIHGGLAKQIKRTTRKVTVDDDAIAELRNKVEPIPDFQDEKGGIETAYIRDRIGKGAHPLLEARILYAGARQVLSHYLNVLVAEGGGIRDRIYPETSTHTQDNGRWSITNPPLAQLPSDLRDIVVPDLGYAHIHWDWNAAEPWVQAATMRSSFLEQALSQGWDLNTLALCDLMGWPYPATKANPEHDVAWTIARQWEGKDDPRRRLAKAGRLALDYGKLDLSTLPGIARLGLAKADLKTAGERILASDPDKARYMAGIRSRVKRGDNISRDWTGARRVFLGTVGDSLYREWLNHPFQRGVASLLALTVAEIIRTVPGVQYAWSMHDACDFSVSMEDFPTVYPCIRRIVEQERNVNGYKHAFKATWSIVNDKGERSAI